MNMNNIIKFAACVLFLNQLAGNASSIYAETNNVTPAPKSVETGASFSAPFSIVSNETNGWRYVLSVGNAIGNSRLTLTECEISITNVLSTNITCWSGAYGPSYSRIILLDSDGTSVHKTKIGEKIGTQWADREIEAMVKKRYADLNRGVSRTDGFVTLGPGQGCSFSFSLFDLFEIDQPGNYVMKIQTPLIQRTGGEKYQPDLNIVRIPEVSVRIQLRPM
jgi:hypothetical protein